MNQQISASAANSKIELALILDVDSTRYQLDGSYTDKKFSVLYAKPINEAIDLGTVKGGLIKLGDVLLGEGEGRKFYGSIEEFIKGLPTLLKDIIDAFLTAHVVITRLEITNDGTGNQMNFAVGLGLLFSTKVSIGGIALEYFTFDYKGVSGAQAVKI
ncbi:MAG: hypothetical protein JWP12_2003 [Bacteroidetes bacterium]|nr:hypothetical protein [Bacteroidota bacterium]